MSHDVIYFPSEKCFSDGGLVCPMDPSEPSESIFVHRSQIASIGHICKNSMKTHAEDDSSITTEERDENSSEEEQSNITTENSSEEEIDLWSTLINEAASKVRDQYDDILQALLMEGHNESEAKQEAIEKILPVFQKKLGDVYMDNLAWMKALKKYPIHKKMMGTREMIM